MTSKLERWRSDPNKVNALREIDSKPQFQDAIDTAIQLLAVELRTQKTAGDNLQGACKLRDIIEGTMTAYKNKEDRYGLVPERTDI